MSKLLQNCALFASVAEGKSGAKFTGLAEGADDSLAAGFNLKPRIELRTGFFHRILEASGLNGAYKNRATLTKLKALSEKATWNSPENAAIEQISDEYLGLDEPVLMVRANSTLLDAGGNGAYLSKAVINSPENISSAIKEIMASFFSPKARSVRKEAGKKDDELAIMIEPMVWEVGGETLLTYKERPGGGYDPVYGQVYAPRFSGLGKTENPYGGPRIGLVGGLAFEYMNDPNQGLVLVPSKKKQTICYMLYASAMNPNPNTRGGSMGEGLGSKGLFLQPDGTLCRDDLHFNDGYLDTDEWTAAQLFTMMDALKKMREVDQYIEWSMVRGKDLKPIYFLNQRSDVVQPFFQMSSRISHERIIGNGGLIMGAGSKKLKWLARIDAPRMGSDLGYVNKKYPGYALSFGKDADKYVIVAPKVDIEFEDLSSASCIMCDVNKDKTLYFLEAHIGGVFGITKKLVVAFDKFDWEKVAGNSELVETTRTGIKIYRTDLTIEASEKTRESLLYLNDK